MEGNADETSVARQVCWPPRFMPGFVKERGCKIPCPRGIALPLVIRPQESVAAYNLDRDRILVRHDLGLERPIEGAKEQILRLRAQLLRSLEFLRRWLKERHLLLFLFPLQPLQGFALSRGKLRITDAHVGEFVRQADNDAVGTRITEKSLDFRIEQFEQVVKLLGRRGAVQCKVQLFLVHCSHESALQ